VSSREDRALEAGRGSRDNGRVTHPARTADVEVVAGHGRWNRGPELAVLRHNLGKALGCPVAQFRYDTRGTSLEAVSDALADFVAGRGCGTVHLVGHSLGGLVCLHALVTRNLTRGRAVLLGSPVNGAAAFAGAMKVPLGIRLIGGLLPEALALAPYAPPYDREVGVIAGEVPLGMGRLVAKLHGPNDGTVAVAETRLAGCPHLRVRASHTGLLFSGEVARSTARFLKSGAFVV